MVESKKGHNLLKYFMAIAQNLFILYRVISFAVGEDQRLLCAQRSETAEYMMSEHGGK